jgi:predicted Holliday junction resolvase-like endonuclease
MSVIISIPFALAIGLIIGIYITRKRERIKYNKQLKDTKQHLRLSMLGQEIEQLAPFANNFKYSPKDTIFIGNPFDLLVMDGLSQRDLRKIVFVEVKTGKAKLSKNEKMIADCIKEGRVTVETIRIK